MKKYLLLIFLILIPISVKGATLDGMRMYYTLDGGDYEISDMASGSWSTYNVSYINYGYRAYSYAPFPKTYASGFASGLGCTGSNCIVTGTVIAKSDQGRSSNVYKDSVIQIESYGDTSTCVITRLYLYDDYYSLADFQCGISNANRGISILVSNLGIFSNSNTYYGIIPNSINVSDSGENSAAIIGATGSIIANQNQNSDKIIENFDALMGNAASSIISNQDQNMQNIIDNFNSITGSAIGGQTDEIINNQNSNSQSEIDNANQNKDEIINNQNQNSQNEINNANQNKDEIIDNQNQNFNDLNTNINNQFNNCTEPSKNLFDKNNINKMNFKIDRIAGLLQSNGDSFYLKVEKNTDYTVSVKPKFQIDRFLIGFTEDVPKVGDPVYNIVYARSKSDHDLTSNSGNYNYLVVTENVLNFKYYQVEKGTVATEYEEYSEAKCENRFDTMNDSINQTNDLIGGESDDIESSACGVICKLKGIVKGIVELPKKLVELLIEGLKNLFVPSDEQLYEIINDSKGLTENFGFVGEAVNFFLNIFTSLLGMANSNGCVELPEFTIGETSLFSAHTFWNAQQVCLSDNVVLSKNIDTIRTITSIVLVGLFLNFASSKFFSILSKNDNERANADVGDMNGVVR